MKNNTFESVPLLRIVVSLMTGILVGEYVAMPLPLCVTFMALVVLALLLWKSPLLQSVTITLCFLVLGAVLIQRQKNQQVSWPEGEVCYEAVVLTDPVEKPKTMAVDILLPANHRKLKAYLYKDDRSRALSVGDGLRITHLQTRQNGSVCSVNAKSTVLTISVSILIVHRRLLFVLPTGWDSTYSPRVLHGPITV